MKLCKRCGNYFEETTKRQIYCCSNCRKRYWDEKNRDYYKRYYYLNRNKLKSYYNKRENKYSQYRKNYYKDKREILTKH